MYYRFIFVHQMSLAFAIFPSHHMPAAGPGTGRARTAQEAGGKTAARAQVGWGGGSGAGEEGAAAAVAAEVEVLVGAEAADGLVADHAEVGAAGAAHMVAARVALDGGAAARAADPVRRVRAQVLLGGGVAGVVGPLPALVALARRGVLRARACQRGEHEAAAHLVVRNVLARPDSTSQAMQRLWLQIGHTKMVPPSSISAIPGHPRPSGDGRGHTTHRGFLRT